MARASSASSGSRQGRAACRPSGVSRPCGRRSRLASRPPGLRTLPFSRCCQTCATACTTGLVPCRSMAWLRWRVARPSRCACWRASISRSVVSSRLGRCRSGSSSSSDLAALNPSDSSTEFVSVLWMAETTSRGDGSVVFSTLSSPTAACSRVRASSSITAWMGPSSAGPVAGCMSCRRRRRSVRRCASSISSAS